MIRLLIVDDHAVVREGLKQIFSDTSDIVVADEASSAEEAINKIIENNYDVILTDISMPGRGGLELLQEIKEINPELRVLILSMHPEQQYALRALKAGASGYLTKNTPPEELIKAIRKIAQGRRYITETVSEQMADDLSKDTSKPLHETLSDREYQTMRLIASGKTVSGIAKELSLSVKTVSTYRSRILVKMNMKNNAAITYYAIKQGLVD
ncbi:MAG: response regulator transcription factor [Caldithrix sp.]|nr:MAG: response regulator transcription factor [Caldithrix sp.]